MKIIFGKPNRNRKGNKTKRKWRELKRKGNKKKLLPR